jgi:hypothetical protein
MNAEKINDETRKLNRIDKIKQYRSIDDEAAIQLLARIGVPDSSVIRYRLVVGGIGIVYDGESKSEANLRFRMFVLQSNTIGSQLARSRVTLFKNYKIMKEYHPPDRELDF